MQTGQQSHRKRKANTMLIQKRALETITTAQAVLKSARNICDSLSTEDALSVLRDVDAVNQGLTNTLADVKASIDSEDIDFVCGAMQKAHNCLHNAQCVEAKAYKAYAETLR
jgi:hypothetical protein